MKFKQITSRSTDSQQRRNLDSNNRTRLNSKLQIINVLLTEIFLHDSVFKYFSPSSQISSWWRARPHATAESYTINSSGDSQNPRRFAARDLSRSRRRYVYALTKILMYTHSDYGYFVRTRMKISSLWSVSFSRCAIFQSVFTVSFRRRRVVIAYLLTLCTRHLLMKVLLPWLLSCTSCFLKSVVIQACIRSVVTNSISISLFNLLILALSPKLFDCECICILSFFEFTIPVLLDETWFYCDRVLRRSRRRCSSRLQLSDTVLLISFPTLGVRVNLCSDFWIWSISYFLWFILSRCRPRVRTIPRLRYSVSPDSSSRSRSAHLSTSSDPS